MDGQVKVAVVYYSATGITYQMAQAACEAAGEAGAEVRLRKVRELAPDEAIRSNSGWQAHHLQTQDVPEAQLDDLSWADVIIFGSPTRYGMIAAQLKQFIDTTGPLWSQGAWRTRSTAPSPPPPPRTAGRSPRCCRCSRSSTTGAGWW